MILNMYRLILFLLILFHDIESNDELKKPTIFISILARNKGHTLPYFLTLLERLNYPKDRISLW